MKVSAKKLRANRENAKKSTGPKTPEGKKKVSQNSVKHGLYARAVILDSPNLKEDLHEYNRLVYDLTVNFDPQGLHEEMLVRDIANCHWRLNRAINAENAQISRQLQNIDGQIKTQVQILEYLNKDDDHDVQSPENLAHIRQYMTDLNTHPTENVARGIRRHERHLVLQLQRYVKILFSIQDRRKAESKEPESLHPPKVHQQTQTAPNQMPHNLFGEYEEVILPNDADLFGNEKPMEEAPPPT